MSLDRLLPPLPPESLEREDALTLARHPGRAVSPTSLAAVLDGTQPGVVTSACRVPRHGTEGLVERVLGVGDRRDVVLQAARPLGRLPHGTEILSSDARTTALLRAHHPGLVPRPLAEASEGVTGGEGVAKLRPEVRPLWSDPGMESAGEVVEAASWLPAPGQGVAVLLHTPSSAHHFSDIPSDPSAHAILQAERVVGDAFSFAVPLVRAQLFGEWLSVHAIVLTTGGDRAVRARVRGDRADPAGVGHRLVEVLMERGGALLRPSLRA